MIYIKYKTKFFKENEINALEKGYRLKAIISDIKTYRLKAIIRIIKNELKTTLKNYPEIDIYIDTRFTSRVLGRFYISNLKTLKTYPKTENPFIVLYNFNIIKSFNNPVYSLKEVLLHEFLHFKQWLLNKELKHDRILKASEDKNIKNTYYKLKRFV